MLKISEYEYSCKWKEIEFALNNLRLIKEHLPRESKNLDTMIDVAINYVKLVAYRIDTIQNEYQLFIKELINNKER